MKFLKKIVFTFIILISIGSFAQESSKDDTLNSLIKQSLDYYPRLKEQQQLVSINEIKDRISKSNYLPSVSVNGSYTYVDPVSAIPLPGPNGTPTEILFQPKNNWNSSLDINQTIYDFGRTSAAIQKGNTEVQLSKQNIESIKNSLAYQVSNLYYGIIYLKKAIEVQVIQLNLVQENTKVIQDRIKNGDEIDFNLISTQVRYKNLETRMVDLQNQLEKQIISLNNLVGKNVSSLFNEKKDFKFSTSEISTENAFEQAQSSNWDIKMSKLREEVSIRDVRIAQAGKLPNLSFVGSVGWKNGYQPDIYLYRFNGLAGVRLTIPIFNGFRNNYQIDIAQKNYSASKFSTEIQSLNLKNGVEQSVSEIKSSKEKLRLSESQVQQAQYAVKLAETRYKNGVITSLEQLTAQTNLQEAQLNKIQFEYQLRLAYLELNRLAAVKFWE